MRTSPRQIIIFMTKFMIRLFIYETARANTQAGDEESGPVFVKEPPSKVDFSNSTGAEIPCQARGTPQPEIIWLRADGTAVGDVPGLRQVKKTLKLTSLLETST